jgi:hypothetical protein
MHTIFICTNTHSHTHTLTHTCMCTHTNTHTQTQTHTYTDKLAHTQTDNLAAIPGHCVTVQCCRESRDGGLGGGEVEEEAPH